MPLASNISVDLPLPLRPTSATASPAAKRSVAPVSGRDGKRRVAEVDVAEAQGHHRAPRFSQRGWS